MAAASRESPASLAGSSMEEFSLSFIPISIYYFRASGRDLTVTGKQLQHKVTRWSELATDKPKQRGPPYTLLLSEARVSVGPSEGLGWSLLVGNLHHSNAPPSRSRRELSQPRSRARCPSLVSNQDQLRSLWVDIVSHQEHRHQRQQANSPTPWNNPLATITIILSAVLFISVIRPSQANHVQQTHMVVT